MTYPIKIGISECLERFADRGLHEFIAAVGGGGTSASRLGDDNKFDASANILGYIDLTTGRKCNIPCKLKWYETIENVHSKAYHEYFKEGTVYRVKGYVYQPKEGERYNKWNSSIVVSEIVMAGEYNAYLTSLYAEWERPVVMESEIFGQLIYNKQHEYYPARFNWLGTEVKIEIDNETDNAAESLKVAEEICRNCVEWDKKFKEAIGRELTSLAEYWIDDSGNTSITEEEFISRLTIELLDISDYNNGTFYVWYDDGGVFAGHSVTVYGNLVEGVTHANMEG